MSADNFNHIRRIDDKWCVWLSLSASCTTESQVAANPPDRKFDNMKTATTWAQEQGFVEYGTQVETGHYVTSAGSDYFVGYCECNQKPCTSCVEAKRKIDDAADKRIALIKAYFDHHGDWPQGEFIDDVVKIFNDTRSK